MTSQDPTKVPVEAALSDRRGGVSMIGRVISDDFEIRRKIGQGGMGTVYEAWQRSLRRPVAIKVLSNTLSASSNVVQRFQREAQAAAKLHHPNIVPIYAQGEHEGLYYYVMEYVAGRGLNEIIAEQRGTAPTDSSHGSSLELTETKIVIGGAPAGKGDGADRSATARMKARAETARSSTATALSASAVERFTEMARLMATAADALAYAHKNGVIHRDIKPHNFLYGDDGRLSITDFGLARVQEQPGMTMTGEFVGSPLYMSPEQISGAQGRLDHRTDIYSLGATLYEWLTLRPPFPGETREQVISQIVMSEPVAPRTLNPRVPLDLETICLKALEKSPAKRYPTASEMADDLRRFLRQESIKARREGLIKRSRKFIVRHRAVAVTVGVIVAVLSLAWAFQSRRELRVREKLIIDAGQVAQAKESRIKVLEAEKENLSRRLGNLPIESAVGEIALDVLGGVTSSALSAITSPSPPGQPAAPDLPSPPGTAVEVVAQAQQNLQLLRDLADELIEDLRKASLSRGVSRTPGDPRAGTAEDYFREALSSRDPSAAMGLVNMAIANAFDHFDALYLRCLLDLKLGSIREATADIDALIASEAYTGPAYTLRGLVQFIAGAYAAGLADLDQAAALEPRSVVVWAARGAARSRLGRYLEALDDLDRAIQLSPKHVVATREREQTFVRVRGALDALTARLALEPGNYDLLVLRGDLNDIVGDYGSAVADYEKAAKLAKVPSGTLLTKMYQAKKKLRETNKQSSALNERSRDGTVAAFMPVLPRNIHAAATLARAVAP